MSGPPQVIAGRYELTEPISTGGMGQVWRGYDTVLDRDIAVKLIRPGIVETSADRDELIARFRREARVTAKIEHSGVPAVYDAAFDENVDRLFLVMQLVHGFSLADVLAERGALQVSWAASIAAQVCAVLSYAHAVPVVHRDLKPGNIMISRDGGVKVLDFGVAALLRNDVTKLTSTGRVIGTKPYMSPEQIQNNPVTPLSDLYSLGCLLHELLCGARMFTAEDEIALMYQHLETSPTPLREIDAGLPAELERLVLDLVAKRPADRPASAWDVYDRLLPFIPLAELSAEDLEPAPGAVGDPTRPYRSPVGLRPRPGPPPKPTVTEKADTPAEGLSMQELIAARDRAFDLIDADRFSQAADVAGEAVRPAVAALGRDNPAVLELRTAKAVALFLGGDFRRALSDFTSLTQAYARTVGPDDVQTLECRHQAAYCQVELGQTAEALTELEALLPGYRRLGAEFAEDVFKIRRTILDLRLTSGQRAEVTAELPGLYREVAAELGTEHELACEIQDMILRLDGEPPAAAKSL
ncbi:serine/threonine-protein kinase [Amycolatopsis keratiniphila]|uniref:serine/threonine-protein kinase n=1 Tax=Amycolatopsis keratiniphila TaxID=129921 RepID=UPI000879D56F|nr:serine/threonine-protein kinase [Amycolatopsis keratiniphila]OLZ51889.1 serine/threonine protein kinase [Amycolatopsis keratiniphila subsp. nogabecina]SDU62213.1 Serine/threonine protein kinase [Amycolatopsis keratiniphila]